jgi:hypothetical protein
MEESQRLWDAKRGPFETVARYPRFFGAEQGATISCCSNYLYTLDRNDESLLTALKTSPTADTLVQAVNELVARKEAAEQELIDRYKDL